MIESPLFRRIREWVQEEIARRLRQVGISDASIDASYLSGQVNQTVVQVERLGPVVIVASENLAAGDMVDVWNDGGTVKARKASAALGYAADGFVIAAVSSGSNARVFQGGLNNAVTGVTPGQTVYLSATSGGIVTAAPTTSGYLVQPVGVAVSATSMVFQPKISILLA